MKKFYLIFAALLVSLTTLSASAATMTFKLDHPERFTASSDNWGITVPEISGDTYVFEYAPTYSWYHFNLKPKSGCYIVSCIDDATGQPVELSSGGYVSISMTSDYDGKTFTLTSGDKEEERQKNSFKLTIDKPEKANIKFKSADNEYLSLDAGENTVNFIPGFDTPLTIMSSVDAYSNIFYKVILDGKNIDPVTEYGRYSYSVDPQNGSELEIVTAFPEENRTLTIKLPEALAADFSKVVTAISVVSDKGRPEPVAEVKPELSVKMGRFVRIVTSNDYKFVNYTVNGGEPQLRSGSDVQIAMTGDMEVALNIVEYKDYAIKFNVDNPANIKVQNERAYPEVYEYELQAGENTIYVPENYTSVNIRPNEGCYITSCTGENVRSSYDNSYFYFYVQEDENGNPTPSEVTVVTGAYSKEPIEITLGESCKEYEFNKIFSRVTESSVDGIKDVEMTATGFTAYAGHKYNVYNNTSDYDVANVRYVEGEDVTTEGYSCLTFTVTKEGGVIEADVTPFPTRTFTLNINDLTNATVYRGYYSEWSTNVLIEGLKENEPNEITLGYGTYYSGPQLSVVTSGEDVVASVTSAAEGTLQNIGFYVKEENDVITVDVRKIVRDKYAVVYVKNRDIANFTFRCANKAYTELYDASYFDEGHNWIFFDDSFDNPLSFNMNGQELYSDDIKVFQNNEKVTVDGYGFSVPVKHNDIIKIFLGETDTEFFTVNWTVEGNPEFGVMLDEIKVLTPADLTAAPSQELPGTKYTIHPADPTKPFVVTVNSEPVEKVAGDDYYEIVLDKAAEIKVSDSESAITGIETDIDANSTDVYNLQGIRVLTAPTQEEINALPAGLYIQKGKKIVVK